MLGKFFPGVWVWANTKPRILGVRVAVNRPYGMSNQISRTSFSRKVRYVKEIPKLCSKPSTGDQMNAPRSRRSKQDALPHRASTLTDMSKGTCVDRWKSLGTYSPHIKVGWRSNQRSKPVSAGRAGGKSRGRSNRPQRP